jgi:hypothetical protein
MRTVGMVLIGLAALLALAVLIHFYHPQTCYDRPPAVQGDSWPKCPEDGR